MASAMRPHSASWESALAQVSAASWSLSGSWWSARVFAIALSSSRRNAAAPSGPAAATAPELSSPGGGGNTGQSCPDALIVQRSLISLPSNTGRVGVRCRRGERHERERQQGPGHESDEPDEPSAQPGARTSTQQFP